MVCGESNGLHDALSLARLAPYWLVLGCVPSTKQISLTDVKDLENLTEMSDDNSKLRWGLSNGLHTAAP